MKKEPVYVITAYDHNNCLMVRVFSNLQDATKFMTTLKELLWKNIEFNTCYIQ